MSSSVWNILAPIKTGVVKIAGSGNQLFGTVIQHGVNLKTVTVRVTARNWCGKYQIWLYSHKNKQVHDEYAYCVTGDKVIIKSCVKVSTSKAYFVKNIVKPFGRDDHYHEMRELVEKERKRKEEELALKQLEDLAVENAKIDELK